MTDLSKLVEEITGHVSGHWFGNRENLRALMCESITKALKDGRLFTKEQFERVENNFKDNNIAYRDFEKKIEELEKQNTILHGMIDDHEKQLASMWKPVGVSELSGVLSKTLRGLTMYQYDLLASAIVNRLEGRK